MAVIADAQPDRPGLGGLLPGQWCRPGRSPLWTTTCGSSPTSGPHGATRTSRSAGSSAGTSASSTSSGTTTGYSATATAAPAWSSSPGRPSNGTCRSGARHHPMTPPWPSYWADRREEGQTPARQVHPAPAGQAGRAAARCAGTTCCTADQPPQSPEQWERWWLHGHPQGDQPPATSSTHGRPGPAGDDQTRLVHASCQRGHHARQRRNPAHFNLQRPRGLLEPCAAMSGTHGSEGAPAFPRSSVGLKAGQREPGGACAG